MRLLLLLLLPITTLSQNIIYQENCDGLILFAKYVQKQTSTTYGITQIGGTSYSGAGSARFELRDTDSEIQSGTRSEITFLAATNLNRWYSFAIRFPRDGYAKDYADEVISQWHQGGGKTPALCLRTRNDILYLRVLGVWKSLGYIVKDTWQAYVLHVKHAPDATGLVEIWRDGKLVFTYRGQNMYRVTGDLKNPNWKLGIYKSPWNGSSTTDTKVRVLYFDDIKMGSERATLSEMTPKRY
jgi:hypothetical protein